MRTTGGGCCETNKNVHACKKCMQQQAKQQGATFSSSEKQECDWATVSEENPCEPLQLGLGAEWRQWVLEKRGTVKKTAMEKEKQTKCLLWKLSMASSKSENVDL